MANVSALAREPEHAMGAYILRRILLIIPTIIGIMAISFAVVQFAPGGPIERIIAQLQGTDVSATARITGGGDFAGTGNQPGRRRRRGDLEISRRPGARPGIHQVAGEAVRLRQAAAGTLRPDAVELCPLRLRPELFPRHQRAQADRREAAGFDLARPVDDAALLRHLDPARHPQGGQGRLALRHVDERGDRRRLRHPRLPVRHPADRPVRRRLLPRPVPASRADLGQLGEPALAGEGSSTISGTWRCR